MCESKETNKKGEEEYWGIDGVDTEDEREWRRKISEDGKERKRKDEGGVKWQVIGGRIKEGYGGK